MFEARSIKDILDLLHIDVIGEEIESVHNMIRESYTVKKYVVGSYDEFKQEVSQYYSYHFSNWIEAPTAMPLDMAHGGAREILDYSPDTRLSRIEGVLDKEGGGGYVAAVKNCLSGRHGGLVGVIDAIAEGIKQQAVKRYVRAVFLDCVNPLDFDKRVAFMQEYLNTYGGLLLPNEDLLSVYDLAANFEAVIQHHVRLVNEFRKTLQ